MTLGKYHPSLYLENINRQISNSFSFYTYDMFVPSIYIFFNIHRMPYTVYFIKNVVAFYSVNYGLVSLDDCDIDDIYTIKDFKKKSV